MDRDALAVFRIVPAPTETLRRLYGGAALLFGLTSLAGGLTYAFWNAGSDGLNVAMIAVTLLLLVLTGVLATAANTARNLRYIITDDTLRIRGSLYDHSIPHAALRLRAARIISLNDEPTPALRLRLGGLRIAGLEAGWFTLGDGNDVLVFLTDPSQALLLPTDEGYDLLLSVERPDALLAALRET